MPAITPDSWRVLPAQSDVYAELAAGAVAGVEGVFLAVDHEGARHVLLAVEGEAEPVSDERSRGIRALTRQLTVQGQPERQFIDVMCALGGAQDVFNIVVTSIVEQVEQGAKVAEAVQGVVSRWRRFWGTAPESGLTPQEVRGLFAELWFVAFWLVPRDHGQIIHWLGPTGTRHDFQWPGLAVEAKESTSIRGHVHWINGLDQLEPPGDGRLFLFSLRLREEATASNSIVTLVDSITNKLENDLDDLDGFETRLMQAGYSPAQADRYAEMRFRVVSERLYRVDEDFPRLSAGSFLDGVPRGIERVEYEINLEAFPHLIVANAGSEFVVQDVEEGTK
jgi:hypothetical protein